MPIALLAGMKTTKTNRQDPKAPRKGDAITFAWRGAVATGRIMYVKRDGTITVKPDSDNVNEGCYIDLHAARPGTIDAP